MTDPAGKLRIQVDPDGVTITSSRPVRAAALFVGREIAETGRLLPALFSICATAQSAASVAAIEQALGVPVDPGIAALRLRLVEAETLREHLWRILLDWPGFIGEDADAPTMAQVMRLAGERRTALAAGLDPFVPGATRIAPDQRAADRTQSDLATLGAERVFGHPPADWLSQMDGLTQLTDWAHDGDTAAARLFGRVIATTQAGSGRSDLGALPRLAAADLDGCLDDQDRAATDAFVAQPTWDGQPRETSPLTRQLGSPLLQDLTGRFGNGLLPRLAAQLSEVACLMTADGALTEESLDERQALPAGVGLSQVQAARGLLVHRVRVSEGRIAAYRILAPTEWNFHPRGVVAAGLTGLARSADPAELEPLARLFCAAVDPCVGFDLQFPGPHRRPQPQV